MKFGNNVLLMLVGAAASVSGDGEPGHFLRDRRKLDTQKGIDEASTEPASPLNSKDDKNGIHRLLQPEATELTVQLNKPDEIYDPPTEGVAAGPPEDYDNPAMVFILGEALGDYDGAVYSDQTDRPAENIPDFVADKMEEDNEPGPPESPGNPGGNGNGNAGNGNGNGNGANSSNFEVENGRIRCIVEYKPGMKDRLMRGLQDQDTHYEFDKWNTVVISIPENALNGLRNNPNILNIYPDTKVEITLPDGDGTEGSLRRARHLAQSTPYGVNMLDVNWLKKKGEGIEVCVIDTGYKRDHEDLPYSVDWAGVSGTPPTDTNGHGTHVSGTIIAQDNGKGVVGVSPAAGMVVGPFLAQTQAYISDTIDGIEKCRDEGATVVNMSYGPTAIAWCLGGDFHTQWEEDRLNEFYEDDNMILVAAAGNHGECSLNSGALSYPASYPSVLSVAAVNSDGVRAGFSARNNQVNLAAPGVDVKSTYISSTTSYKDLSGTSMASPHVAGVAARVWSTMPYLTAPELRTFLLNAAQDESQPFTGNGLVNTGFYTIMLKQSGKCLDNWSGWIKLWTCGVGYTDQQFTYDYFNNMIVGSDGKCLRAPENYNGGRVYYSTCDPSDGAQKWTYSNWSNEFKNAGGYCLDNHGSYQFQNGGATNQVHMWTCHGGSNQKWLLGKDYETRLYQDSDMYAGGRMYRTPGAGNWYSMPTAIKNDRLTRTIIPIGFAFEYFEHSSFGGWNGLFGSHDFSINLYMGGHNDAVSSFKVRKLPDGKVKLCKHSDCSSSYYDCDWVKNYSSMPSEIGNDQLTRVLIPRGYQFQYFEHSNFGGWSGTFGSCDNAVNLYMGGHNDAVSSFKIKILDC